MKNYFYYFTLLSMGIIEGLLIIYIAGMIYSLDLIIMVVSAQMEYKLGFFGATFLVIINIMYLLIISIPILLLSNFIINYYVKMNLNKIIFITSIGLFGSFIAVHVMYTGVLVMLLSDITILGILNYFLMHKTSHIRDYIFNSPFAKNIF